MKTPFRKSTPMGSGASDLNTSNKKMTGKDTDVPGSVPVGNPSKGPSAKAKNGKGPMGKSETTNSKDRGNASPAIHHMKGDMPSKVKLPVSTGASKAFLGDRGSESVLRRGYK